jgi:predicted HD superfamily hydrolase involved in NAD metabolism
MNKDLAIEKLKLVLSENRFNHSIRVYETALKLNEIYKVDVVKLSLAAILHDYAKNVPIDLQRQILENIGDNENILSFNSEVWHSYAGAELVRKDLGITDEDILQAIKYHTIGHTSMTLMDKVVFIADYIEPGRDFPGVEKARELAVIDIDKAMLFAITNTIEFLIKRNIPIAIYTIELYNQLVNKIGKG